MENTLVRRNSHQLTCVCIHFRCPWLLSSPFEQKVEDKNLLRFWTTRLLLLWLRLFVRFSFLCWDCFFFFYKTRRFHFPAWRPIKDHKKALSTLNKPRLGIAVKAPWTLREQSPGAPSPSAPQENCKRISERGETWGGKVFHVQNSHLGTALGKSSGLSTHMELQRFLGAQSQGRGEQRAPSSSCGIVAKDCLMVTTLFHSSCFQSAQKPHIIHQGIPTWAKKTAWAKFPFLAGQSSLWASPCLELESI